VARQQLPGAAAAAQVFVNRMLSDGDRKQTSIINATGILAPGGFCLPIADAAIAAKSAATAGYSTDSVEMESLLRNLSGAEAAIVLHSTGAATSAVMATLGERVIVARAHVGEVDGVSLAEFAAADSTELVEVGTNGRVSLEDYRAAMHSNEGACIWIAKPFSMATVGDVTISNTEEVFAVARDRGCPSVEFLDSATLVPIQAADTAISIPLVRASLESGADLVIFSGDRFIGGPSCGIVVGNKELIERLAEHPFARACAIETTRAAALTATLRLTSESAETISIPILQLLTVSMDNLKHRAERLATQLRECATIKSAEIVTRPSYLNDGRLSNQQIPGYCVAITVSDMPPATIIQKLLDIRPGVAVEFDTERVVIHLRTVLARQDEQLLTAFRAICPATPSSLGACNLTGAAIH